MNQGVAAAAALYLGAPEIPETRHLIFIVNGGGVRKRDYYEEKLLSPNIAALAESGFVFEEDHCERVASHDAAFAELLQGRVDDGRRFPTVLDYIGNGYLTHNISRIPAFMQARRPRILVCRETVHDVGHDNYEAYLQAVRATDTAIGKVIDWVKDHPYFSRNTAIVIRPEFGRDDEVNVHGSLHHSYGFYCTHRVATIFWGPGFNTGVDAHSVIRSIDMAPTLARVFNVAAPHTAGRVVPGLWA